MDVKTLLLTGGLFFLAACSGEVDAYSKSGDGAEAKGESLYKENCLSCHGVDGKAGVIGAKDLSATNLNSSEIYRILVGGKGIMPPFEYIITSEKDRNAVVEHIISLRH